MNVYDFAPELDLSKEEEGYIFGEKGKEGSEGIVYAKVFSLVDVKDYSCDRCIFYDCYKDKCLLSRSDRCVEGEWICRYEQAAIEGESAAPWAKACGCRWNVVRSRSGTVYCGT